MKHIVVWSGGCDSTLILLDLIKKGVDVEVLVFDTNRFGDGKREYVSTQDGVHPSEVGQKFIAEQIANTLVLD